MSPFGLSLTEGDIALSKNMASFAARYSLQPPTIYVSSRDLDKGLRQRFWQIRDPEGFSCQLMLKNHNRQTIAWLLARETSDRCTVFSDDP